ncbi:hypothetical protein QEZ40_000520 [Streptomyces katrae]|uniref:Uncharacterized protein n=1 Tax=Streptomyces katrae TaxID=68223 RepID=A0ABT7GSD0_9ACTN|nr:hypothetical protein [Streptomyces katrae]MDK9496176.1 hypothetical protein [Streptomyces katrae]
MADETFPDAPPYPPVPPLRGQTGEVDRRGVQGNHKGLGVGVKGWSAHGIGVVGQAEAMAPMVPDSVAIGVKGISFGRGKEDFGVLGESVWVAPGVKGDNSSTGPGVAGSGSTGPGVLGTSGYSAGVHGKALLSNSPGVHGEGTGGPGVLGTSQDGCGGVFESPKHGQIHLKPAEREFTPDGTPKLPRTGKLGELLAVLDPGGLSCSLWVCVSRNVTVGNHPAGWAAVELGPVVLGEV